jgi:hypothetical protein
VEDSTNERYANPLPKYLQSRWRYIYASVYILCIDDLLKEFDRRYEDLELMNFTLSSITDPPQEGDISKIAELISSVFKENVSELEPEIINLRTD